jgi:hypothetical protein
MRVARGSGCTVHHVSEVIQVFQPFKKVAGSMKGLAGKKGRGGMPNMVTPHISRVFLSKCSLSLIHFDFNLLWFNLRLWFLRPG